MTHEEHQALPEEVRARLEIVDGAVVVRPAPPRAHEQVVRNLVSVLTAARPVGYEVDTGVGLLLREVPLLNRRPDLVVHDSPDRAAPAPEHCLLVAEVVSRDSLAADRTSKPAHYAATGVPHFWRIESLDSGELQLFRYRLDPTTRVYASAGVDTGKVSLHDPFPVTIDLAALL
ncbi:Uma2 family endonuclease [Amycolatopsis sp. ATCC 39116]|uniref:Uma2 family endonuclease n=1 Tax=Amycolatopsis sp. (strain ATCC 39116 / 75iv2) TaxID=385957 RepID=UPI00210196D8|nr:Uma2 family endonuclease [Amycolatopsis sp. ATCC 39116]